MTILTVALLAWATPYAGAVLAAELMHCHRAGLARLDRHNRRNP